MKWANKGNIMLQGLAKTKALKELKTLVEQKASLKGLALAKALKRIQELRVDLGMGKNTPADTNTNTSPQEYADTILFNKSGQILLAQRSAKDDFKPNKWWIVGGKIEQDEIPKQGAIRELAEETGVKLSDLKFVEKANLPSGGISHRFAGVVKDDTPIHLKKDELQAYAWVDADKLGEYELLGALGDLQDLVELGSEIAGFDGDVERDDEAVVIDGKEFKNYNLDFEQESNKQLLRDEVRQYLENLAGDNGKYIFNNFLGRDVLLNGRGIREMLAWSHQVIKLQILHSIEQIIKRARGVDNYKQVNGKKDKKAHAEYYYHLETPIQLASLKLTVKVIIEEDANGLLQYDVRVPRTALGKNKALYDALTHDTHSWNTSNNAYAHHNNKLNEESQDDFVFDRLNANIGVGDILLNLFVFDENGNEVGDEILGDRQDSNDKTLPPATDLSLPANEKPFDRTNITIPRTKTTRQKANNQAFVILDKLDNGEITPADLTDDDKAVLAQYSGNGGALKGRDGKTGSDYEYYTPKALATGMWELAKELGFDGGRVLDPCAGTGVFTATSPDNVLIDAVELDETSGRINQLLNDGNRSQTTIAPFEKVVNGYDDGDDDTGFDLVITNVPFGDNSSRGANKLFDTAYQDASLDYYFILRSLEKLKSGGLAVLMTTPATIHGKGAKQIELRQKTSRIAEFMGAYRLPNSMFADTGADVSVDVVVFKKFNQKMIETVQNHYDNGNIEPLQTAGVLWDDYISGHYFKRHPNNVLGTVEVVKNRFGGESEKVFSDLSQADIAKLLTKLGGSRIDWELLNATPASPIAYKDGDVVYRQGTQYVMKNGVWAEQTHAINADDVKYHEMLEWCKHSHSIMEHGISLDDVKQMLAHFAKKSVNSQTINDLKSSIGKFSREADWQIYHTAKMIENALNAGEIGTNYRTAYPFISQKMKEVLVLAKGGHYQGEIGIAKKLIELHHNKGKYSDLWNGNVDTAIHENLALTGSLSAKIARLQYNTKSKYMAMDDFKTIAPDIDVLTDDDYFITADGTQVILAQDFLVGSLADRLADIDAQIDQASDESIKLKLIRQRQTAIASIPTHNVKENNYNLRNPLIPAKFKAEFLRTVCPTALKIELVSNDAGREVVAIDGTAKTNLDKVAKRIGLALQKDQRLTLGGAELAGLDEKQSLEYLNKVFNEWNVQFNAWVKANDRLIDLLDSKVNDPKNRYFVQNDDESPLEIHGLSDNIKLHGYQNAFVRQQGRFFGGINGFGVGLGKTFTSLASVQHAHNIGLKQKTLFVLPKSVLSNWRKEAMAIYANADDCLFVGLREEADGFTVKANLFDEDLLKAVAGKYRKIFLSYEAFARIKLKDGTVERYLTHLTDTDDLYNSVNSDKKGDSESGKGLLAQLQKELTYASNAPYLEDMGIDSLVIDEAHAFKNSATAKSAGRTKYLSNPAMSKRGMDTQAKAWYIRGLSPNFDGVQMLTATPITNSPLEIYAMLSLSVGRERANAMLGGIKGADDFIQSVCDIQNETIDKVNGQTGNADVFVGLTNIKMLRSAIHSTATIKNADTVKGVSVVIPEREAVNVGVVLGDEQIDELKALQMAYTDTRQFLKDGQPPKENSPYWEIKAKYGESDELIAHPFNLIRKMEVLISDDDFGDNCTYYDFDEVQSKIAKKVVAEFNKKPPKDERVRLSMHTKDDNVIKVEYDDDGDVKSYQVLVACDVVTHKGRYRLMLDSMDYHIQQRLEALCEKMGLALDVTISPKISALLDNVKAELSHKRGKRKDGTTSNIVKQIIFCDHLHLHSKITRLLVDKCGIAKNKIAIITGKVNGEADEIIDVQNGFNAMDDDNVYQIVLANKKAEVGINLQVGTQAIHHLTTGWTPDSLEQRNGRGARQGNHTESVQIYYYDANGTFDSFKREMINKKDEWISDLLSGDVEHIAVVGELSDEDKNALIESIGNENAISQYLAQRDEKERQHRLDMAKTNQRIHLNTIVQQKKILDTTNEQMVHQYILDNLIPVANGLTKSKMLYKDRYTPNHTKDMVSRSAWNAEQQKAFDKFVPVFEKVVGLYNFDGLLKAKSMTELAYDFIYQTKGLLGSTSSVGMGSKNDDLYGAFLYGMMNASGVDGWDKSGVYDDRKQGKFVRTDTDVYQAFIDKQATAKKLIDSSSVAIDDIAKQYDGMGQGVGLAVASGQATFIGDEVVKIGGLIKHKDRETYGVITKINGDTCAFLDSNNGEYGNKIGKEEIVVRGSREQYAIADFTFFDEGMPAYLEAIKELAQIALQKRAGGGRLEMTDHLPALSEYLANADDLTYQIKQSGGFRGIDTKLGFIIGTSRFKDLPPSFIDWYKKELEQDGITHTLDDSDYTVYTIPAKYTVQSAYGYNTKRALGLIIDLCNQNNWVFNDEFLDLLKQELRFSDKTLVVNTAVYQAEFDTLLQKFNAGELSVEQAKDEHLALIDRTKHLKGVEAVKIAERFFANEVAKFVAKDNLA